MQVFYGCCSILVKCDAHLGVWIAARLACAAETLRRRMARAVDYVGAQAALAGINVWTASDRICQLHYAPKHQQF